MALMALEKRLQKQLLKRLNNSYKPKYSLDFSTFVRITKSIEMYLDLLSHLKFLMKRNPE